MEGQVEHIALWDITLCAGSKPLVLCRSRRRRSDWPEPRARITADLCPTSTRSAGTPRSSRCVSSGVTCPINRSLQLILNCVCVRQGSFHSPLDSSRSTRHHGLVERVHRDRRFVSPSRPYRRQVSFKQNINNQIIKTVVGWAESKL